MQWKATLLTLAGAAHVHKMVLRMDISICMWQARTRARVREFEVKEKEMLVLLHAIKRLNSHLQHIIPPPQRDLWLRLNVLALISEKMQQEKSAKICSIWTASWRKGCYTHTHAHNLLYAAWVNAWRPQVWRTGINNESVPLKYAFE